MDEDQPACKIVHKVAIPLASHVISVIRKSKLGGSFKPSQKMVQLLHNIRKFMGLSHEDPQVHLQNFLEISDTFIPTRVSTNYVRLTLFPFTVLGEAKKWLNTEPLNPITTWVDMTKKLFIQLFPSSLGYIVKF